MIAFLIPCFFSFFPPSISSTQLERQPHEMGAVLPHSPHHHRPVPVPGRGEGSAGGRPREGQHQAVCFLLPRLQGQNERSIGPLRSPSPLLSAVIAQHFFLSSRLSSILSFPDAYSEQEKVDVAQKRDVEGMGIPEIKYGESMCFVQHVSTALWLTYAALDAKAARLGMMKRKVRLYNIYSSAASSCSSKSLLCSMSINTIQVFLNRNLQFCCPHHQVILHQEGHMDDALTVSRSQTEESQAARMIYSTMGLFRQFIKYVKASIHLLVRIA